MTPTFMMQCVLAFVIVLAGQTVSAQAQEVREIIQPVNVVTARPDTVVMSDLFYAKEYSLNFLDNARIAVSYDQSTKNAIFRPKNGFVGATLVEFAHQGKRYAFPVTVQNDIAARVPHVFKYTSPSRDSRVLVTGSFNNWNKQNNQLIDANGTGTYELALPLEPGSYIYKFIVDGKEILDPANPEKSPTGFDDFNSVLRVVDPDTARLFLHVGGLGGAGNEIILTFVCENSRTSSPLSREDIIALIDNRRINSRMITVKGDVVNLRFTRDEMKGKKTVRVMVSQQGKQSNLQQIRLRNGAPAGLGSHVASWEDGIIYSIMIDRFSNGDRSNDHPVVHDSIFVQANYQGGDLRGIIDRIGEGYFESLGVNILWISPVNDNPNIAFREYPPPNRWYSGYHGYWPISDTNVEEKFGTMDELKELVAKAHGRGIRVLLDFVAHHVHIDHPFYKEHPEWFGTLDLPDGRKNLRLWDEFRLTTWFEPYMPSFDFTRSREALEVVSRNAIWWLKETGADGFRHDAVKHVPNVFWRELTRRLKEEIDIPRRTTTFQIGETFGDYDLIASYVKVGQLSAQFNFNLSYFAIPVFLDPDRSFESLDFHMKRSFSSFGPNNLMGNIMDSHDKVRFMAYADGKVKNQGVDTREMAWKNPPTVDHPSSYKKAELYLAYMFTIPGLPVVYYGSEFGMTGADDPDNRRMMRFGDQLNELEEQMLGRTRTIVKMRNVHSALRYGDFLTLKAHGSLYAYLRSDFNERLLIVLNKGDATQHSDLTLPNAYECSSLTDINTGEVIEIKGRRARVPVDGIGWRVLRLN